MLTFEVAAKAITPNPSTRIKVVGVGGAGGNTINTLLKHSPDLVEYIVINTDAQAIALSHAPQKLRIGHQATHGRGSGANPDIGRAAAEEDLAAIIAMLDDADMVFLIGGLGGGTGSGAIPVIAHALRERNILTVCIVTKPFGFEGRRRMQVADQSEGALADSVDALITIPNEKLLTLHQHTASMIEAFEEVNRVIGNCVQGIVDIILKPGHINVDFADVQTVMKNMGTAVMGTGRASGVDRALIAATAAVESPYLAHTSIRGARSILINVTGDHRLGLHEIHHVATQVTAHADPHATIIIGSVIDETMGDDVSVTVIATGFSPRSAQEMITSYRAEEKLTNTTHHAAPQSSTNHISPDHPLRNILPSLEKRLKEQYNLPQEELEIPTLLRKLRKEQESTK